MDGWLTQRILLELINEESNKMIRAIAVSAIKESAELYLRSRPNTSTNPIVSVILQICNEVVDPICKSLVRETIQENVNDYLLDQHAISIFNKISLEYMISIPIPGVDGDFLALDIVNDSLIECEEEESVTSISREVVIDEAKEIANEILYTMKKEQEEAQRIEDRRLISLAFQKSIAKRLALAHLLISITDGFENVLLEHHTREIVKRMIAERLIGVLDEIDHQQSAISHSLVLRESWLSLVIPQMRKQLLDLLWESASSDVEEIELIEAKIH